jgi:hypothetical protein
VLFLVGCYAFRAATMILNFMRTIPNKEDEDVVECRIEATENVMPATFIPKKSLEG